ncbi:MAG: hypothetical protein JW819_11885 [Candidatus Krumholzibacteriota bacterium]|nr:hypothetical protein [Candidatus Krumholzibacteriota bacterium]
MRSHLRLLIPLLAVSLLLASIPAVAAVNTTWQADAALRAVDDAAALARLVAGEPWRTETTSRPELPLRSVSLLVPAGERIAAAWLEAVVSDTLRLSGPLPAFAGAADNTGRPFACGDAAAGCFPAAHLFHTATFAERGLTTAEIVLAPFLYEEDADGARLIRLRSCRVAVETEPDPGIVQPLRQRDAVRAAVAARALRRVANPGALAACAPASAPRSDDRGLFAPRGEPSLEGSGVDMVIICAPEHAAILETLAEHKTQRGVTTVVRDLDWIRARYPQGADLQETIRTFLQDALAKWGIQYVLLAGDAGIIPVRYVLSYFEDPPELIPSDLYYAQLDGDWNADGDQYFGEATFAGTPGDELDFIADVHLGRLPIRSDGDAQLLVDKIIAYTEAPDTSYVRQMAFMGEVLFPPDYHIGMPDDDITRNGADYCEIVYDNYLPGHIEALRWYETYWLYPGTLPEIVEDVYADMETRAHLLLHVGHGYRYTMSCGSGNIVSSQAMAMTNGLDHLFSLYSLNCTSCAIDYNCLGEAFLLAPEGGGITSIGTAREAFPNTSVYYQNAYFSELFADTSTVGACFTFSHNKWSVLASVEGSHRWTQLCYVLIGDPSIDIWLDTLTPLTAALTQPYTLDDDTLHLVVSSLGRAVPGALAVAAKAGEDRSQGVTDAAGYVALPFRAESLGDITVTVTGNNRLPFHGEVAVAAGVGPRLAVDALRVVDDPSWNGAGQQTLVAGNSDSLLDAGETVRLAFTVHNRGDAEAADLIIDLSLPGGELYLVENQVVTGETLAPGDSLELGGVFLLKAPFALVDGESALLDFALGYTGGSQADRLDVDLHAPVPRLFSYTIDDATGDGDGEPDAGETYTILPEWKNYGSTPLVGWTADLTALDPDAQVLGGEVGLPILGLLERGASDGIDVLETDVGIPNRFLLGLTGPLGESVFDTLIVRRPQPPEDIVLDPGFASTVIDMTWEIPAGAPDGYLVFRSLQAGGPYTLASTEPTSYAYFRNEELQESTTYYFVVESLDSTGFRSAPSEEFQVSTNPAMLDGWPLATDLGGASSLAVGDIDGDGDEEVVAASYFLYAWHHDGVEVLDGDGNSGTYGVLTGEVTDIVASIALAQVDTLTPGLEIITTSKAPVRLCVLDANGQMLPGWPKSLPYWCWATPAAADVDNDGCVEIFAASLNGKLYAWNHDGTEVVDGDGNASTDGVFFDGLGSWVRSSPALGQLDEDPELEIVVGSSAPHKIFAWNHDGTPLAGWPLQLSNDTYASPSLGDLDDDGVNEIVVLCENDSLYALRNDATPVPGFPVFLRSNAAGLAPSPALCDFEDDGQMEIVAAGVQAYTNSYVTVLDNQGNPLPGWPVHLDDSSESSPVVVDLNDDQSLDIMLGTERGYIYAWDIQGQVLPGFPILTQAEVRATPTICDLDGDYTIDIGLLGWDAFVYVWDLADRYRNGMAQWKMFRANAARTGVFTRETQITAVPVAGAPGAGRLWPNFPNPFNPSTRIRFATPAGGDPLPVALRVHDVRGRLVRTLFLGELPPDTAQIFVWDGRDETGRPVASGVYLARVTMGEHAISRKMVMLK